MLKDIASREPRADSAEQYLSRARAIILDAYDHHMTHDEIHRALRYAVQYDLMELFSMHHEDVPDSITYFLKETGADREASAMPRFFRPFSCEIAKRIDHTVLSLFGFAPSETPPSERFAETDIRRELEEISRTPKTFVERFVNLVIGNLPQARLDS